MPHRQKPRVGGNLPMMLLDNGGRFVEKTERDLLITLRRHAVLSCLVKLFFAKAVKPSGWRWRSRLCE
jgi:hypothetical protein